MRPVLAASFAVLLLGALPASPAIDLTRYYASPAIELQDRTKVLADASAFLQSATPATAPAMLRWLETYDALLGRVERHDIYAYLRAEEDDGDVADAKADEALGNLEGELDARVVRAARDLGEARIGDMLRDPLLAHYRYLLLSSLAQAAHALDPRAQRTVELAVQPVLDASVVSYKALRKLPDPVAAHQDAYAALLTSIVAARNGVAKLRGFSGGPEASYFDKSLSPESVERALAAVAASTSYARYLRVAALAPAVVATPSPVPIADAIPKILAAEKPMGDEYAAAYAALLDPANGRLEICTGERCDEGGFSVGFTGLDSAVFFAGYAGTTNQMRAVAHESGHAVHRQFMSRNQAIAAYTRGPNFMFESFAIFNELLFLDSLRRNAETPARRAYYLDVLLDDATFQVYGSAEETDLESAIYRGVENRSLRTAADFNALATAVFSKYDPVAARDPKTAVYWAKDRLYFTDPLYDVNYLYAGLLAENYFAMFERDPHGFSKRYVALLKNGFDDAPAPLLKKFLGIDLTNEAGLVVGADAWIDARTAELAALYSKDSSTR